MKTNNQIEHALTHALTKYDAKQSGRRGYNMHALGIYLGRVAAVMADIDAGAEPAAAITAGFTGRLQDLCLKACGFAIIPEAKDGCWYYQPIKLTP